MKQKFILAIVLIITSFSTFSQELVDEIHINKIILSIVKNDSLILEKNCKIVDGFNSALQSPANSFLEDNIFSTLNPYFVSEDLDYYSNQIKSNKKIRLKKADLLDNYKFIKRKKIINFIAKVESDFVKEKEFDYHSRFEKKIGKIQEFGLPLISTDGKYALVRFFCINAPKKNRGFLRIYENKNENWIMVKSLREWNK